MEPDIEQQIPKQQLPHKKSLCRFFLRGLCIYSAKQCDFSHGIADLNFQCFQEGEEVVYDYLKENDFCQKNTVKGPSIYQNLYDFQTQKVYTLQQLGESRPLRSEVRNLMHQQMFEDFIDLLEIKYPDTPFTEDFLIREYTRAGFNKLMTRIKFSHLTSYLCDLPNSRFFKHKNTLIKRATPEEIDFAYRSEYEKIIKKAQKLEENEIKKLFFLANFDNPNVPPLNQMLKEKKINFSDFLKQLSGGKLEDIKMEASIEEILVVAKSYLDKQLESKLVIWNQVYLYLSKHFKINNGNILNQIKPCLAAEGYYLLFFPMLQLIYHPKRVMNNLHTHSQCPCEYQKPFSDAQLMLEAMNWNSKIQEGESIDIINFQTLIQYAPHILKSEVLAVDIEGRLRRGGYIEMIQLNNGKNTFLLDIYQMNKNHDFQTAELISKILRNVMVDQKILKIFHDCRHDSLALHQVMMTCVRNIFDTSAVETCKYEIQNYEQIHQEKDKLKKAKEAISLANNIKTPGLNEILNKYNAPHGINKNKQLYHKMWSKGDVSFFDKRPLDPDYRQYCIKDVLDLPFVEKEMTVGMSEVQLDLSLWVSSQYVKYGYEQTLDK